MPSIKRNSRTNLILDREQKGERWRQERRPGEMKWETFVKNRADQNFTVGICRCPGDRATRSGGPIA